MRSSFFFFARSSMTRVFKCHHFSKEKARSPHTAEHLGEWKEARTCSQGFCQAMLYLMNKAKVNKQNFVRKYLKKWLEIKGSNEPHPVISSPTSQTFQVGFWWNWEERRVFIGGLYLNVCVVDSLHCCSVDLKGGCRCCIVPAVKSCLINCMIS